MNRALRLSVRTGGERLDRFLAAARTDLSRSGLQALIKGGQVQVNGREARPSLKLKAGDQVLLTLPEPRVTRLEPEAIPLSVIHEDAHLVVLDKPAGQVVHPGAGVRRGTLVHALLHRYPEIASVGGEGRPGIVHRLDKNTSGLMVVARTPKAYLRLVEAIRLREVGRVYNALVWGSPRAASGTVEAAIGRDPRDRKRMAVVRRGGKEARSHWRVTERLGIAALLEVRLDTGRTHQIRVHMAHLGHPVAGDPTYEGRGKKVLSLPGPHRSLAEAVLSCLPRQALHASGLKLAHPESGDPLEFASPWPDDFTAAVETLRARRVPTS